MKNLIKACFCAISFAMTCSSIASELNGDILIKNVNILVTQTMSISPNMDVLIKGQRIAKIGRDLHAEVDQIIDGHDRYLSPGLIDSHTHLSGVPGMSYQQTQNHPEIVALAKRQIPRSYLYHGFTSVIDLHSDAQNIERWNAQSLRPQAYFCGGAPLIDGYPMNFIPKPVRYQITPYFLVESDTHNSSLNEAAHSPKSVINRMRERGAVCVKTHYETGFGGQQNLPVPSTALIKELVSEAHSQNLKVVLHANSQDAHVFGVNTGVDAFVHGMWRWNDSRTPKLGSQPDDEIEQSIGSAIERETKLQPTFQVLYGERELHDPDYLNRTELRKVLPKELLSWYRSEDGQSFKDQVKSRPNVQSLILTQGWQSIDAEPIKRLEEYVKYWLQHNGGLLFGSDTPSDLTYANPPGLNGRYEMARWQQLGVSPRQFLAAATIENAAFFNLHHDIGSVDVGKRADLLLLTKNPLKSIDAFDTIEKIFVQGQMVERESLSAAPNTTNTQ